jgi:hypothetical protein
VAYQTSYDEVPPPRRRRPFGDGGLPPVGSQHYDPRRADAERERDHERQEQERMVDVRNAALLRMREMNSRHGMHAFDERRGADALGPHAIAFLWVDTEQDHAQSSRIVVRAATRLFRDDEEVRHLPTLMNTLSRIAHSYIERGGFDPRLTMVHRRDKMSQHARYVGVGVSSLDTIVGQWTDIQEHARSAMEICGRSYVHLVDDTRMILDRGGQFGAVGTTYSNRPLEAGTRIAFATWRPLHHRPGEYGEEVWAPLSTLNQQVYHGLQLASRSSSRRRH